MKSLKKLLCVALAAIMVLSLTGCSTPKVALTVDGKDYSTGEYLANLFSAYSYAYSDGGLGYAEQQGYDIWSQMYTYENQQLDLSAYLREVAIDDIIRQKAIANLMEKEGVVMDEETAKEAQATLNGFTSDDWDMFLSYGIGKENYTNMFMASYNEQALFMARYDKGGSKAVAEEDIRKYFDDNYLSYKMISVNMMSNDAEMTEDKQKTIKEELEKYLKLYNDGKSFNEVIAQYNYDTSTNTDKKLETLTDADTRQDLDAGTTDETDFANTIKTIKEGEAKVVTYKQGGTELTAALILRLDPEEGDDRKTYFEDNRQNILAGIKYEEFNTEIQELANTLQYTVNQKAYKMCDPRKLFAQ